MRIGIVSYPMLFQREAAIQLQVRETMRALDALRQFDGVDLAVALIESEPADLDQYDLIHVFSASGGNLRIIEAAAAIRVPIVLSPLISPAWSRVCGEHARQSDQRLGGPCGAPAQSSYAQTRRALELSSVIVALGESERRAIAEGFLVDRAKVLVFPNGVSRQLFEADGELFRQRTGMHGPFVLMDGPVSPYRNQLGIARALAEVALPFVLLGETRERDQDYLRQVRMVRGVTCLGGLKDDSKLLASAFAAASVLVLSCQGDVCARTVFDALAAGTPVVVSATGPIFVADSSFALRQVAPADAQAQQRAVLELIAAPPERERVRALARPYTWERAALQLASCYVALAGHGAVLPA